MPVVTRDTGRTTGTEVGEDVGSWMMWQLVWVLTGFVWTNTSVVVPNMDAGGLVWVPEVE